MSILELVLLPVVALLSAAWVVTTVLWLRARRKAIGLRKRLDQVEQPRRRRRRLVPTPTQAVRGAVETAIMVKDHGLGGVLRSSIEDLAGWADVERPDLVRIAALDGTVTILFSDIEDSTALNHELGDRAWVHLLQRHDRIVHRAVQEHGGHVVKTQGDGFMVAFGSPEQAVRAAIDVQRDIAMVRPGSRFSAVNVRIGAHRGSTVHRDNDLFGRNVAHAARVASQAEGGEILVSDTVLEQLDEQDFVVTDSREVQLKGIPGSHHVHAIDWAR
ncbi:adenylate/guanylate cyclase domain-containing protein [Aeromicrobium sp. CF4.19]|uniref:adenylate/guanylate cyclase domain-containing protein n=1 Tax=Aeromicrobium sp. CF4.19 TaxID=3373082 RepID=UPI003EE58224